MADQSEVKRRKPRTRSAAYVERKKKKNTARQWCKQQEHREKNACVICGSLMPDRLGQTRTCSHPCKEENHRRWAREYYVVKKRVLPSRPAKIPPTAEQQREQRKRWKAKGAPAYNEKRRTPEHRARNNKQKWQRMGDPARKQKEQQRHHNVVEQRKQERIIVKAVEELGWVDPQAKKKMRTYRLPGTLKQWRNLEEDFPIVWPPRHSTHRAQRCRAIVQALRELKWI